MNPNRRCDTDEMILFYENEYYPLSNFSAFRTAAFGFDFDTSEHAYHFAKFRSNIDGASVVRTMIRFATSAHDAFKIAEENVQYRRPDWLDVRVEVMRKILLAKVNRHSYVQKKLMESGDRFLVEDSWRDDFWGWGEDRKGRNELGRLWMSIRHDLRMAMPDIGKKDGTCGSPTCAAPGAMFLYKTAGLYVCERCARKINEAMPNGGPVICAEEK